MKRIDSLPRKDLTISNIVCTADLKQKIDIASFNKYKFLSSNLNLYKCGYVKDDDMIGRVTIFGNGKMISVGTKSSKQANKELIKASKILQKYKLIKSCKIIPKIQNIVSIASLDKKLNLNNLARTLPHVIYEPEQFSGLIYRIHESIVALIFASGKVVLVGAKNVNEMNTAFFDLLQKLKN